jgi:hypothetical protein
MANVPRVLLVSTLVVAVVVTVGTSAFSATTAERGVDISVADDEHALLGIERQVGTASNGTVNLSVTVTNRFAGDTLTSVVVTVDGETRELAEADPVRPGEQAVASFAAVDCTTTIGVRASGPSTSVSLTRPVPCQ